MDNPKRRLKMKKISAKQTTKFLILHCVAAFSFTNAVLDKVRPFEIGAMHTRAFMRLSRLFEDVSDGMDEMELVESVVDVISSLCDKNDSGCRPRAYQATISNFYQTATATGAVTTATGAAAAATTAIDAVLGEIDFPDDFDPYVYEIIETVKGILELLPYTSQRTVLKILYGIMKEVSSADIPNPLHKKIGVGVVSIATSSTALWSNTARDLSSPLHKMSRGAYCPNDRGERDNGRRKLAINERIAAAVQADIAGAVRGAKVIINESQGNFDLSKFSNEDGVLRFMLEESIAASAAAFTGSGI